MKTDARERYSITVEKARWFWWEFSIGGAGTARGWGFTRAHAVLRAKLKIQSWIAKEEVAENEASLRASTRETIRYPKT